MNTLNVHACLKIGFARAMFSFKLIDSPVDPARRIGSDRPDAERFHNTKERRRGQLGE